MKAFSIAGDFMSFLLLVGAGLVLFGFWTPKPESVAVYALLGASHALRSRWGAHE